MVVMGGGLVALQSTFNFWKRALALWIFNRKSCFWSFYDKKKMVISKFLSMYFGKIQGVGGGVSTLLPLLKVLKNSLELLNTIQWSPSEIYTIALSICTLYAPRTELTTLALRAVFHKIHFGKYQIFYREGVSTLWSLWISKRLLNLLISNPMIRFRSLYNDLFYIYLYAPRE